MIIRPVREADVLQMCGKLFDRMMRGIAVEDDGELVAVAGVIHQDTMQCFSEMTDRLRRSPKNLVRAGRVLRDMLDGYTVPVFALTDPDKPAHGRFLEWMGFRFVAVTTQGRLYRRCKQ